MARRVFYSFHYDGDSHRVAQVRQMGVVEGQPILSSNGWEDVAKGGDAAIEKYIDAELSGKSCLVVLIGSQTAGRKWVNYEIKKAWAAGKGVMGVHIHRLKNLDGQQATKGANPFAEFTLDNKPFAPLVQTYDPPFSDSKDIYRYIADNLPDWVETAVSDR